MSAKVLLIKMEKVRQGEMGDAIGELSGTEENVTMK